MVNWCSHGDVLMSELVKGTRTASDAKRPYHPPVSRLLYFARIIVVVGVWTHLAELQLWLARIAGSLGTCSAHRGAEQTTRWGARAPRQAVSWLGRAAEALDSRGWLCIYTHGQQVSTSLDKAIEVWNFRGIKTYLTPVCQTSSHAFR